MRQLVDELKRRNVIRVAVAYAVAAWVLLQIADLVLENIGAPEWVMKAFMLALALGFPLVVIFSWAFELTPEGLKLEKDIKRDRSITDHTAKKLDVITVGLLVMVLVIVGIERFVPRDESPAKSAGTEITEKSIAVLAFDDLSPGGDQEYFAEGISEELLNVLAQIPDLKVAGRTSSFAFKGQDRSLPEIGEILDVAHILEGSVKTDERGGVRRIRVWAELVKADDGFALFSRTYERNLTDIFEVQDDIAREIVAALRSTILGEQTIEVAKETSVEAYEKYLQARQWIHTRNRGLMEKALAVLDQALELDPDYAPALSQKALSLMLLSNSAGSYGEIPAEDAQKESRPLLDRALELDPGSAEAHAILGLWWYRQSTESSAEAVDQLRKALQIAPKMANANNWLALELGSPESHNERIRLYEAVVENDPLYGPAFTNVIAAYVQTRELDKAGALIRRVERISGKSKNVLFAHGALATVEGRLAEAIDDLEKAYDFNPSASTVQLWYSHALMLLGEYDTASKVARDTDKLLALTMAGRTEAAQEEFDSLRLFFWDERNLRGIGAWMLFEGRAADFIDFLESEFGNGDDMLVGQPRPDQLWGASHFTSLAYALKQAGRDDDAKRVIAETRKILDLQAQNGADNLFYWVNKAEFFAVTGEVDAMLDAMQKAIESGHYDVAGFYSAPFEPYRDNSRFMELASETNHWANMERSKRGLPTVAIVAPPHP